MEIFTRGRKGADYVIDRRLRAGCMPTPRCSGSDPSLPYRKDFLHSSRAQRQPLHYSRFHAHCVISQAQSWSKNAAAAPRVRGQCVTRSGDRSWEDNLRQTHRSTPNMRGPGSSVATTAVCFLVQICPLGAHARLAHVCAAPAAGKEGKD